MPKSLPSYIQLHETGALARRIAALREILVDCTLCPRYCHINRLAGEKGFCKVGALPMVSSYGAHFGEERCLVGQHGSGTIFMTWCNLRCVFCQNYDISQLAQGEEVELETLSEIMLSLQAQGCHNINFVTPSHQAAQIVAALPYAIERGLNVPLVYNCGGYENVATLKLLDGIFDIYLPDFKYGDDYSAMQFSGAMGYVEIAKASLLEMQRQVGVLELDETGTALRGLLIRHLVLPEGKAGSREVLNFIAREISPDTYVNIMDQYHPCFEEKKHPPLNRPITEDEYREALALAREAGLWRLDGSV